MDVGGHHVDLQAAQPNEDDAGHHERNTDEVGGTEALAGDGDRADGEHHEAEGHETRQESGPEPQCGDHVERCADEEHHREAGQPQARGEEAHEQAGAQAPAGGIRLGQPVHRDLLRELAEVVRRARTDRRENAEGVPADHRRGTPTPPSTTITAPVE